MSQQFLPGYVKPERQPQIVESAIPSWMPASLAGHLKPGRFQFSFSKSERRVFRKRKHIEPSDWSERHRVLRSSSIKGRWRNIFTPYLPGIMDAMAYPSVEIGFLCKSPQTGGTEAGHNLVGWAIEHAPGPIMYVFPDELTARENAKDRIIPMLEDSPRLREYLTGHSDDTSSLRINLAHLTIYMGWSGSVARLGNKPIRLVIGDELDKWKNPKNEADSKSLVEKRTITWKHRRIILYISTPSTPNGPIWIGLTEEAHAVFDWWVRCPACNIVQLMKFDNIRWPEEVREPEEVLAHKLARYQCEHCTAEWDDGDRDRAVRRGEWRDRATGLEVKAHLKAHNPMKVGFHIPAWISYFVSLSEVAHAFLKWNKSGKLDDLKNFVTQYKAEPWREQHHERKEESILALCDSRPRGVVPVPEEHPEQQHKRSPVAALLAAVDTQHRYLRYVIRAFGYGESEESWLVQAGTVQTFSDLSLILWGSVYRDGNGKDWRVYRSIIDAMGTRTPEVYRYCLANRGRIVPYQGVQRLTAPLHLSPLEFYTDERGHQIRIDGGLVLFRMDTNYFKSDLSNKLTIQADDPGAFHLHANTGNELEQYAREMCAEVWSEEKNCWINPHERDNHYWDCETMLLGLAHQLNIRNWRPPAVSSAEFQTKGKLRVTSGPIASRSAADRLGGIRRRYEG